MVGQITHTRETCHNLPSLATWLELVLSISYFRSPCGNAPALTAGKEPVG